jgi:DNA-binding transcriptional ArsR family regulator
MVDSRIGWDIGTAYDLFISLHVLHSPTNFGLRPAWAAGMRSRLPSSEREFLEDVVGNDLFNPPLAWVYNLPEPKDTTTALEVLEETPPAQRLMSLTIDTFGDEQYLADLLRGVAQRGKWTEAERDELRTKAQDHYGKKAIPDKMITGQLNWWARSEEFGDLILSALQAYHEVFYAEEERRIRPILESELARAQELAEDMPLQQLVETLSKGVRLTKLNDAKEFILAPSYWGTPFMFFHELGPTKEVILFGARPEDASLVPGETVPDSLVNALKALSDPTRLRILRYLSSEALTPTQLARRLRLRAPTVIHHLQMLRSAGLVYVLLGDGKEKAYQSRAEGILATCGMLDEFLNSPEDGNG